MKGESVPIRLHLSKLNLSPTYRAINNVFSVKYYVNLVLVDQEDRRYFKQQEIIFWRSVEEDSAQSLLNKTENMHFLPSSYMNLKSSNQDEINIISDENNGNVLGENRESNNEKKEIEENLI